MNYKGKLYGKVGGKFIELEVTSHDIDRYELDARMIFDLASGATMNSIDPVTKELDKELLFKRKEEIIEQFGKPRNWHIHSVDMTGKCFICDKQVL